MLFYYFIVGLGFLLLAYVIRILRKPFFSLAENSLALVNTLLLKIDEDEKVKLVQKQNNRLIVALGKVLLSIILAIGAGAIPFVIFVQITNQSYAELELTSWQAILALTIGSTIGFIVPLRKKQVQSYSELAQLLHRMALNNYAIAYKLFKVELKRNKKHGIDTQEKFVIVSGLARAGTTSLMNKLSESDRFASLNYSNMPFITAPNIWKRFYNPESGKKQERSHKDGIMVGLDSNEALEEFFFKVISNDSYIEEEQLVKYDLSQDNYADYLSYQSIIRKDNEKFYLAKNNNFLLRYDSIRAVNRDFVVIFMFRDPLTHAASLLEKHREFSAMQEEDPFVQEYMDWLGHHEFGREQRPFQFSEKVQAFSDDKNALDYWLEIWINYYSYLLNIDKTSVIFVDYDHYCEHPNEQLELIFQKIGVKADLPEYKPYSNSRAVNYEYSEELKSKAEQLHRELKELSQK